MSNFIYRNLTIRNCQFIWKMLLLHILCYIIHLPRAIKSSFCNTKLHFAAIHMLPWVCSEWCYLSHSLMAHAVLFQLVYNKTPNCPSLILLANKPLNCNRVVGKKIRLRSMGPISDQWNKANFVAICQVPFTRLAGCSVYCWSARM